MSDSLINEIKSRISDLQKRLGSRLQVTLYDSSLNDNDELIQAARDCRMSVVHQGEDDSEWEPGSEQKTVTYAVRAISEELGEIPYPLMCREVFVSGESENSTGVNEHTLAMASLVSAVTKTLSLEQLEKLALSALEKGSLSNEQHSLIKTHFLGGDS